MSAVDGRLDRGALKRNCNDRQRTDRDHRDLVALQVLGDTRCLSHYRLGELFSSDRSPSRHDRVNSSYWQRFLEAELSALRQRRKSENGAQNIRPSRETQSKRLSGRSGNIGASRTTQECREGERTCSQVL